MKNVDITGFVLYLAIGIAATYMMPGETTTEQTIAYVVAIALLLIIDLRSYRQGLKRGSQIANEVLRDLCETKKIKVVRDV
jgi:hypothetical protein